MKRSVLLRLAVVAATLVAVERAGAASAVAIDEQGRLTTSQGQLTKDIAMYNALTTARERARGAGVRLIASSDVDGYCAIAVAGRPNGHGSFVTVSLGNRSQAEADWRAIASCLKAGGVDPKVIRRWHG